VTEEVRAAGGLVWRSGADGGVEVLLVHRPRYDDWSFPKGKCDRDEGFVEAAVREVREETGFEVVVGEQLDAVRYADQKGRPKVVRYWLMQVAAGAFEPNDEVDEVRWLGVADARPLLSYEHDRDLLRHLP
jgi:8-oxo-dGTP pyrophosphatase MutT (NUDIX family)